MGILLLTPLMSNAQFWNFSNPEKLEGTVNTDAEENIPVFSTDSSALYFTRTFDASNKGGLDDQDVWVTYQDDKGGYSNGERVTDVNNKFNNAVLGLSTDGNRMYLLDAYDGKKDQLKGLAVAEKTSNGWSSPKRVDIPNLDIDGDFYGFHVNEKEDVIILSYAGPGTLGEEDLYVITKTGGSWGAPQHMGSAINSAGFEISPFLSKNQDTLFFSSNGMGGEGDADIFYSIKQGSWTSWSKPTNLGNVINSPKFDAYFIHNGKQAYWSSNRDTELSDIWMLNILKPVELEISCSATAATANGAADGSVSASIASGNSPYTYAWSNGESTANISNLKAGDYTVTVTDAAGKTMETTCTVTEPELTFPNLALKNNFSYNKNEVKEYNAKYKDFVSKIEGQLNEGRASITIEIHSSASHVPTKTYGTNEKLAQKRADELKDDLTKYFKSKDMLDKVNVVIAKVEVAGPEYVEDSANKDKYAPYQFVEATTK